MMMLSFGAMGLVGVLWILYGFNMSAITDGPTCRRTPHPAS
jgi:Amt family ammonium transporter